MVMPASDRISKYAAKYNTDAIKLRLDDMKDLAISKITSVYDLLATMELQVQVVLNQDGIIPNDRPKYYNFAREIWKLINSGVSDPALTSAVDDVLGPKYLALDCASAALVDIALDVFSITFTPPAP